MVTATTATAQRPLLATFSSSVRQKSFVSSDKRLSRSGGVAPSNGALRELPGLTTMFQETAGTMVVRTELSKFSMVPQ